MKSQQKISTDMAQIARTATQEALALQRRARSSRTITLRPVGSEKAQSITIPKAAFQLLIQILSQMSHGNAVTVLPLHAEVTTQQAADILNVSRPFVISLLEDQRIPFRKVGTHRRVRLADLLLYKRRQDKEQRKVLAELTADAQELDLGY